jgi:hypothetical protein
MTYSVSMPANGVPIGSYADYAQAQRAVDFLSDEGFPVERVTLVGSDLRMVEKVLGRLTTGRAAAAGAARGAWFGLFVGLLLGAFTDDGSWLGTILVALVVGAVFGAVSGGVGHAATHGERDFASTSQVVATRYDVLCDPQVADQARQHLARLALRG